MKLAQNVKIKSFPWTIFRFLSTGTAHAIYPNVYLPKSVYKNLTTNKPQHINVAILIHEQTHIKRQKQMGYLLWMLKYCFQSSFRFNEELEAIRESMKYMKNKNQSWDTKRSAKVLSSYLYLWCISFEEAYLALDKVWSQS